MKYCSKGFENTNYVGSKLKALDFFAYAEHPCRKGCKRVMVFFFFFSEGARQVGVVRGLFVTLLQQMLLMCEARTILHAVIASG